MSSMDAMIYMAIGLAHLQGAIEYFRASRVSDAMRELVVSVAYMSLVASTAMTGLVRVTFTLQSP